VGGANPRAHAPLVHRADRPLPGETRGHPPPAGRETVAGEGRKQLVGCLVIAAGTSLNAKNVQEQPVIGGGIFGVSATTEPRKTEIPGLFYAISNPSRGAS
jgi:hypothetical protein